MIFSSKQPKINNIKKKLSHWLPICHIQNHLIMASAARATKLKNKTFSCKICNVVSVKEKLRKKVLSLKRRNLFAV